MTRNWQELRAAALAEGHVDEANVSARRTDLVGQVLAYRLAEIRHARGLSQQDVAEAMGISQSRVSRIEGGELSHVEVSTLTAYIRALGGDVRLVAGFDDEDMIVG